MKHNYPLIFLPALAIIALDQVAKVVVAGAVQLHDTIPVVNGFFNLVHTRNRGMAFGILNRPGMDVGYYLLLSATIIAVALILFWCFRLKPGEKSLTAGLSFILGGAIGNLIDRIRLREVIDFLDFYVGAHHWPAFNVADSAITVGTLWLAVNLILQRPKT